MTGRADLARAIAAGGGGGFLVVLEDYRIEAARSLAVELGLHFLDLRAELAARYGAGMAWAAPDSLEGAGDI